MDQCFPLLIFLSSLFSGKGETNFSQWVQLHGKVYHSEEEWQLRRSIYTKNQMLVQELHSSDPDVVYDTTGPFADLDMAEFTGKLMPKRSVPAILEEHRESLQAQNLPDSFDWDQKGLVGPVRNQKALGSCWAVSTAEAVEGQLAKATGKLIPLSPEQLVECDASSDSSCAGGKGCYNKAFCGNHDDLYCRPNSTKGQGPQGLCHATSGFATAVTGWRSLSSNEMEMAAQLMQYGPLSVLILADGLQFYHAGVWTGGLLGCKPDPSEGILGLDHAVLAVGFGKDHSILGKSKPYWRLKNSWGTSWGEQGFFRLNGLHDVLRV